MGYRVKCFFLVAFVLTIFTVVGFLTFLLLAENSDGDVSASSNDETTIVSISVPKEEIGVGEQATISIVVEPKAAIAGLQFNLDFDPSLVSIVSVTEGNLLSRYSASSYFSPGLVDNNAGIIMAVYGAITSPGQTVSKKGTFAIVTLIVKKDGANCSLNLSNVVVGNIEGIAVPVKVVNGEMEISQS